MEKILLINKAVLFNLQRHTLTPINTIPERTITMHAPVSHCLSLLLEHNNHLLTHKFLLHEVWEKNGAVVSTNTLYQNIASARKALKAAGLQEDIIRTVTKAGFKCVADIRQEIPETPLIRRDITVQNVDTLSFPDAQPTSESKQPSPHRLSRQVLMALSGVIILCWSMFFLLHSRNTRGLEYYSHIGKVNDCKLYSSWNDKKISTSAFKDLIQASDITCRPGDVAYMTINHLQRGQAIIICDRDLSDQKAQCHSYLFYKEDPYNG